MQGTFRRIFKASAGKFDKKCTPLLEWNLMKAYIYITCSDQITMV
jgi:hypothetical protein